MLRIIGTVMRQYVLILDARATAMMKRDTNALGHAMRTQKCQANAGTARF